MIVTDFLAITATLLCTAFAGKFELVGRSGVPVMHAALLPTGDVVFLDKLENYTEARLPSGRFAYSTLFNPNNYVFSPCPMISNAFCCGGAFLADGTLMTMGGNGPLPWVDDSIGDGFEALRYLRLGQKPYWHQEAGVQMDSRR